MNSETDKLYEQLTQLKNIKARQTREIILLVHECNTLKVLCGILTAIVTLESVYLAIKLT